MKDSLGLYPTGVFLTLQLFYAVVWEGVFRMHSNMIDYHYNFLKIWMVFFLQEIGRTVGELKRED